MRPGQRVAVWLPSRIESVVALLACSRNGYVCCPSLHRDHTVGEIVELLGACARPPSSGRPATAPMRDRRDIFAALAGAETLRHVYRLEPPTESPHGRAVRRTLPRGADGSAAAEQADPNQIVYLAFTSGTTGEPKGVMHTDNTLLANARALATDWSIEHDVGGLFAQPAQPQSRLRRAW